MGKLPHAFLFSSTRKFVGCIKPSAFLSIAQKWRDEFFRNFLWLFFPGFFTFFLVLQSFNIVAFVSFDRLPDSRRRCRRHYHAALSPPPLINVYFLLMLCGEVLWEEQQRLDGWLFSFPLFFSSSYSHISYSIFQKSPSEITITLFCTKTMIKT